MPGAPRRTRKTIRAVSGGSGVWRPVNGRLPPTTPAMTVVALVHVIAVPGSEVIIDRVRTVPISNWALFCSAGTPLIQVEFGGAINAFASRALAASDVGTVARIIATGSVATNSLLCYLNGVPGGDPTFPGITVGVPNADTVLGGRTGTGGVVSTPVIDLALSSRRLTPSEVALLEAQIIDRSGVPDASPAGPWDMLFRAEAAVPGSQWRDEVAAIDGLQVGADSIVDEVTPGSKDAPWGKAA